MPKTNEFKIFNYDNLIHLGTFTKTHGIKGEIILEFSSENYDINEEPLFVETDKCLVPFFIETNSIRNYGINGVILKFDSINSEHPARLLIRNKAFIPKNKLVKIKQNTSNSLSHIYGFSVIDTVFGPIGTVTEFIDIKENPLMSVTFNSVEILIPVNGITIENIDANNKTLKITTPNGLLDIYLNS